MFHGGENDIPDDHAWATVVFLRFLTMPMFGAEERPHRWLKGPVQER
jgi:hypothetical protein